VFSCTIPFRRYNVDERRERNKFKKALASASLDKQAPNEEESRLIHKMWQEQQRYQGEKAVCIAAIPLTNQELYDC
jgi:hypothetical protein